MFNSKLLSQKFFALSDTSRLLLFQKIIAESRFFNEDEKPILARNNATELGKFLNLSQSTLSHHIKILLDAKLIYVRKHGRFRYYFPSIKGSKNFEELIANVKQSKNAVKTKLFNVFPSSKFINEDDFHKLIDYLKLHEYSFSTFTRQNKQLIRYRIYDFGQKKVDNLEVFYALWDKSIKIVVPLEFYRQIKKDLLSFEELIQKFLSLIEMQKRKTSTP